MPPARRVTRESILERSLAIVVEGGLSALTFQSLATALGVSKQAILYWFPSKWELRAAVCQPLMREEAEALIGSVEAARSAREAIERFVRAFVAFYRHRLPQFRVLYHVAPLEGVGPNAPDVQAALAPIHRLTASAYGALESRIAADPDYLPAVNARQVAVAVHMAAVGIITMLAEADALGDPMLHSADALTEALVAVMTGPGAARSQGRVPRRA